MSNKLKKATNDMPDKRKNKKILIGVIVLILILIIALGLWYFIQKNDDDNITATKENGVSAEKNPASGSKTDSSLKEYELETDGSLVIPIDDIVDDFTYVDYGGSHQILLWKDSENDIHTAFNTCQECITRGEARYSYNDGVLTCSVCGNQLDVSSLSEANWGGCQPVSIPEEYRKDTEEKIVFPSELLQYSDDMFDKWQNDDFSITLETYES